MALGNTRGVSNNKAGLASLIGVVRYVGVSVGEVISTVVGGYFTDDATANAYYTDDATANRYLSVDP